MWCTALSSEVNFIFKLVDVTLCSWISLQHLFSSSRRTSNPILDSFSAGKWAYEVHVRTYKQQTPSFSFITSHVYVLKFSGLSPLPAVFLVIHTADFGGPDLDVEDTTQPSAKNLSDWFGYLTVMYCYYYRFKTVPPRPSETASVYPTADKTPGAHFHRTWTAS